MSGSKKVLLAIAIIFGLFLIFVVYDFSRKTTFPGHKHRVEADSATNSTNRQDSVRN